MTPGNKMTLAEYIAALEEPRKSEIKKLDKLIREVLPDLKPVMAGSILGYGPFRYRYATGREGDTCVVCLGSRKTAISLHVFGADQFKKRLPKADIGVACVRFKKFEDLDEKALRDLLKQAHKIKDWIEKK